LLSSHLATCLIGKAGNGTVNKEPELHQELGRHRLLRAAEEFEDLSIVSSMIRVWERVKEVRKGQNFISTKVDLKFKKQAVDSKSDLANRDEELDAEMAELRRLHEHDFEVREVSFLENKAKLETDIKRKKARIRDLEEKVAQANMAEGSDEDASDDDGEDDKPATKAGVSKPGDGKVALKLQSDAEAEKQSLEKSELLFEKLKAKQPKLDDVPLDEETERAKIRERQSKTKRQAGDPMYIPILTDRTQRTETESLPDGKSSVEEGKRRKKIRSLKLVMRISVNGHMLRNQDGQVREIKLQQRPGHDFEFTVNEAIKLAATSGNPEIMIHVCESHGPLLTTELATLLVPIADDVADDRGDPYVFQDSRSDRAFEPVWYEADKKGVYANDRKRDSETASNRKTIVGVCLRSASCARGVSVSVSVSASVTVTVCVSVQTVKHSTHTGLYVFFSQAAAKQNLTTISGRRVSTISRARSK